MKFDSYSDDGEKTKNVVQYFLVSAYSSGDAYGKMKESLSTLMVDFTIPTITLSPIVDIFPYREELDKEISRVATEEVKAESDFDEEK